MVFWVRGSGHCAMYHPNHSISGNVETVLMAIVMGMLLWSLVLQPQRVVSIEDIIFVATLSMTTPSPRGSNSKKMHKSCAKLKSYELYELSYAGLRLLMYHEALVCD